MRTSSLAAMNPRQAPRAYAVLLLRSAASVRTEFSPELIPCAICHAWHLLPCRWLAPELFGGATATPAADVFAFGVVLWELMTWECPWGKRNPWTVGARLQLGGAALLQAFSGACAARLAGDQSPASRPLTRTPALR